VSLTRCYGCVVVQMRYSCKLCVLIYSCQYYQHEQSDSCEM